MDRAFGGKQRISASAQSLLAGLCWSLVGGTVLGTQPAAMDRRSAPMGVSAIVLEGCAVSVAEGAALQRNASGSTFNLYNLESRCSAEVPFQLRLGRVTLSQMNGEQHFIFREASAVATTQLGTVSGEREWRRRAIRPTEAELEAARTGDEVMMLAVDF